MRRLTCAADVIVHEEGDDAFLLHVGSGRYFGLNRSGLIVWNALARGEEPVAALQQRWPERPAEVLRADAEALLAELLRAGLVGDELGEPGARVS